MYSASPGVARRAAATLIDWLALTAVTMPLALAMTAVGVRHALSWPLAVLLATTFYWPLAYRVSGRQTLGKRVVGLRTMRRSMTPLGLIGTVMREAVIKGIVLIWVTGLVGVIVTTVCALVRRDRRGLHDLVLGTRVIARRERRH